MSDIILPPRAAALREDEMEKKHAPQILQAQADQHAQAMAQQRHLRLQAIAKAYFESCDIPPNQVMLVERHFYDKGTFRIEWHFEPLKNAKTTEPDFEQTLPCGPPDEAQS